jgi:hypothetical protein
VRCFGSPWPVSPLVIHSRGHRGVVSIVEHRVDELLIEGLEGVVRRTLMANPTSTNCTRAATRRTSSSCCRAAGEVEDRLGASLPVAAGTHYRWLSARRLLGLFAFLRFDPPPWENTPGKIRPCENNPPNFFPGGPKTPPLLVRKPPLAFSRTPGSLRGWLISQATWPTLGPDRLPAGGP